MLFTSMLPYFCWLVLIVTVSHSTGYWIAIIHNASVIMPHTSSIIIQGTCNECICKMLANTSSIASLNCLRNNNICELFTAPLSIGFFSLVKNSTSSVYALSIPANDKRSESTPPVTTGISSTFMSSEIITSTVTTSTDTLAISESIFTGTSAPMTRTTTSSDSTINSTVTATSSFATSTTTFTTSLTTTTTTTTMASASSSITSIATSSSTTSTTTASWTTSTATSSTTTSTTTTSSTATTTSTTTSSTTITTSTTTSSITSATTMTTTSSTTSSTTTTRSLISMIPLNDTITGLWNTKAGGNGTASSPGTFVGGFFSSETPNRAFDRNPNTSYTSYGLCNISVFAVDCGEDTGVHFTLERGPSILQAFRFLTTRTFFPSRDPMTITIEGSNYTSSSWLMLSSVWTLIYNGSSGLQVDPGRSAYGITQTILDNTIAYRSYRILVTSKRGNQTSTQYAEVELFS